MNAGHDHSGYAPVRPSDDAPENTVAIEGPYGDSVHVATTAEKKRLWWRNAILTASFIASWYFFATLISLYNKWMFSPEHYGFPSPLFVTTVHMWVQFSLAATLRYTMPHHFRPERRPNVSDFIRKVVPTGIATGLDIGLSNLSLKLITLSFYTMCKSSSLVFVLLFAFLFRLEQISWRLVGVIILIFSGVLLMVATQTEFVLVGFILVVSGSAMSGLRWSLTRLLLKSKDMGMNNPAATLFWLAPVMGVTLFIATAIIDGWSKIFDNKFFATLPATLETLFYLISPGVLAFCMVLSEFYILHRAGVVPMSIAGIAKEVTTIGFAALFFGDQLTPLNITGVGITVCGIALYTHHKYEKSLEQNVTVDSHGNPLSRDDEEDALPDGAVALGDAPFHDPAETQRLTMDDEEEDSPPQYHDPAPMEEARDVLFSVADDGDDLYDPNTPNPLSAGLGTVHHGALDGSHEAWSSDNRTVP